MRFNIMEIETLLKENNVEGATYFANPSFKEAILGISHDGRVVYSYSLMIKCLRYFENFTEQEVIEWINVNTVHTIPYMGEKQPIIVYDIEREE